MTPIGDIFHNNVLKSLNSISLFEKYFNEMLKFNSDNYFFKYNSNDLYYSLLKKNYNIKLIEIIKELFDKYNFDFECTISIFYYFKRFLQ